jgi:hypothetical protein
MCDMVIRQLERQSGDRSFGMNTIRVSGACLLLFNLSSLSILVLPFLSCNPLTLISKYLRRTHFRASV